MRCKARTQAGKQCTFSCVHNGLCGVHNNIKNTGKNVTLYSNTKLNKQKNTKKVVNNVDNVDNVDIGLNEETQEEYLIITTEIRYPKKNNEFKDFEISDNDLMLALTDGLTIYGYPRDEFLECQCCFCEYPADECTWCDKWSEEFNHIYCKTCLNAYFEIHTREGNSTLACPSDASEACHGHMDIKNIKKLLTNENMIKLEDVFDHVTVINFSKILENYQICPFCQRYGCIVDDGAINNIKCERCEKEWCKKCKQNSHGLEQCGRITGKFNKDLITSIVEECITDALLHECPVCPTKYTKTEGCNLMTCEKCGSYSCYVCGMKVYYKEGRKYWHFKGSGSADRDAVCPLYNGGNESKYDKAGNKKYNDDRIKQSALKLYNVNDSNEVKIEILKVLQKHDVDIGILIPIEDECENEVDPCVNETTRLPIPNTRSKKQSIFSRFFGWCFG